MFPITTAAAVVATAFASIPVHKAHTHYTRWLLHTVNCPVQSLVPRYLLMLGGWFTHHNHLRAPHYVGRWVATSLNGWGITISIYDDYMQNFPIYQFRHSFHSRAVISLAMNRGTTTTRVWRSNVNNNSGSWRFAIQYIIILWVVGRYVL